MIQSPANKSDLIVVNKPSNVGLYLGLPRAAHVLDDCLANACDSLPILFLPGICLKDLTVLDAKQATACGYSANYKQDGIDRETELIKHFIILLLELSILII